MLRLRRVMVLFVAAAILTLGVWGVAQVFEEDPVTTPPSKKVDRAVHALAPEQSLHIREGDQ